MKPLTLMILPLFLLLAACRTPAGTATRTAPTTPTRPAAPAIATTAPAPPQDVSIPAGDGLAIQGTFYPGPGSGPWPAILLLHMLGSQRQAWDDTGLPPALNQAGYAVLAIDLRGHGQTGGSIDWPQVDDDLPRVWAYLTGRDDVDPARTAIIGASIGANLALRTAANLPQVRGVVLLSPGLDYRGVTTTDALDRYGSRPLLIVASEEDSTAASASRLLTDLTPGEARLIMYDGAGHGTDMFTARPELSAEITGWLNRLLAATE